MHPFPAVLLPRSLRTTGRLLPAGVAGAALLIVVAMVTTAGWLAFRARPPMYTRVAFTPAHALVVGDVAVLPATLTIKPRIASASRQLDVIIVGSAQQAGVLRFAAATLVRFGPGLTPARRLLVATVTETAEDLPTRAALDELTSIRETFKLPTVIMNARQVQAPGP